MKNKNSVGLVTGITLLINIDVIMLIAIDNIVMAIINNNLAFISILVLVGSIVLLNVLLMTSWLNRNKM